jgi:hypothetical protein
MGRVKPHVEGGPGSNVAVRSPGVVVPRETLNLGTPSERNL